MTSVGHPQLAETTPKVFPEPGFGAAGPAALVAVVMDFVGATPSQLDRLLDGLRLTSGGPGLPGSLFQWSRATDDGVRVTEVWRSSDDFELFLRDVIAPRLAAAGMPQPEVTTYDVHSYLTQGPTLGIRAGDDAASNTA